MSHLTGSGWVSLTDFMELEFPTIRSDAEGNTLSYRRDDAFATRRNSPEEKMQDASEGVQRVWTDAGVEDIDALADELARKLSTSLQDDPQTLTKEHAEQILAMGELRKQIDKVLREEILIDNYELHAGRIRAESDRAGRFNRQVRRFDHEKREMRYMRGVPDQARADAERSGAVKSYQEHLRGNILAGPHVIPGLAWRAVLEISRIEAQGGHDALVGRMKNMSGPDLVDMLLKEFIRPQAMLPWSVPVTSQNIEHP